MWTWCRGPKGARRSVPRARARRRRVIDLGEGRDRAILVGTAGQAVEASGCVGNRGHKSDVDDDVFGARDRRDGPCDGVVGAVTTEQHAEVVPGASRRQQAGARRPVVLGLEPGRRPGVPDGSPSMGPGLTDRAENATTSPRRSRPSPTSPCDHIAAPPPTVDARPRPIPEAGDAVVVWRLTIWNASAGAARRTPVTGRSRAGGQGS